MLELESPFLFGMLIANYPHTTMHRLTFFLCLFVVFAAAGCDSGDTFDLPLEPDPILSLSTKTLTFAVGEDEKTISISNLGGGFLTWNALENASWLTLSATAGDEGDQLTLSVDRTDLDPGEYRATVNFLTNGRNDDLTVTLVLTFEESLVGNWTVIGAQSGANALEDLVATFTFVDDEQYMALFDDGTNRGEVTARYTISGKTFLSNLPLDLELNGITSGMDGANVVWNADMSTTQEAFTGFGGTAVGWSTIDGLRIDIVGGVLSLITQDETVQLLYERTVDP